MHLTRFTDLGLHIVLHLAAQNQAADSQTEHPAIPISGRITSATVSDTISASHTHVAKVVSRLAEIGVLISTRGRTGGIRLADGALDYPLGKLIWNLESTSTRVTNVDSPTMLGEVPDNWPFGSDNKLQRVLADAEQNFYEELDRITIREITPDSSPAEYTSASTSPVSGQQAAITENPRILGPQSSPKQYRV